MSQILIVEGSDAIVLSKLCQINRLPPPKGYSSEEKFRSEFIRNAGGFANAMIDFEEALRDHDHTNIGLIVDANDKGAEARWTNIKAILSVDFSAPTLTSLNLQADGIIVRETNLPTVGIWVMPDNQNTGYLEHFISRLVPAGDELWRFANNTVGQLESEPFCKFKPVKRQKALLHTWLAWQAEPGRPFGTALESKYFDAHAPVVEPFLEWMKSTFQLG